MRPLDLTLESVNKIEELSPLVKEGALGKYVFLYDYQVTIYNAEAQSLLNGMTLGGRGVTLPENSTYTLKYSKGDVVDVISFGKSNNDKGVPVENKSLLVIKVPKYVKPITGFMKAFPSTITIDNSTSKFNNVSLNWLQKVADSTPISAKLGSDFGKNTRHDMVTVVNNTQTTNTTTSTPIPTDTPIITNGVQDITEKSSIFDNKNNLLIIAGVLLVGYLLLNHKNE
jgi:hypothetical protein